MLSFILPRSPNITLSKSIHTEGQQTKIIARTGYEIRIKKENTKMLSMYNMLIENNEKQLHVKQIHKQS
jgi:hypothetical protein